MEREGKESKRNGRKRNGEGRSAEEGWRSKGAIKINIPLPPQCDAEQGSQAGPARTSLPRISLLIRMHLFSVWILECQCHRCFH